MLINYEKDISIDFETSSLPLTNKKNNNNDIIFINIDLLIAISHDKLVKTMIYVIKLRKVIINIVLKYYILLKSIISNKAFLFTLNFWFKLYYFFDIKPKLSTLFYL